MRKDAIAIDTLAIRRSPNPGRILTLDGIADDRHDAKAMIKRAEVSDVLR
jgi:hypothetical protein